jgi:hypothetical protein
MKTMDSDLMRLLNDSRISPLEAYMKASNKQEFEKLIPKEALQEVIGG